MLGSSNNIWGFLKFLLHEQPDDFQIYFTPHSFEIQKRLICSAVKVQLLVIGRVLTLHGYLSIEWQVAIELCVNLSQTQERNQAQALQWVKSVIIEIWLLTTQA